MAKTLVHGPRYNIMTLNQTFTQQLFGIIQFVPIVEPNSLIKIEWLLTLLKIRIPWRTLKIHRPRPHPYGLGSVGLGWNSSICTFNKTFNGDSDILSVENLHSSEKYFDCGLCLEYTADQWHLYEPFLVIFFLLLLSWDKLKNILHSSKLTLLLLLPIFFPPLSKLHLKVIMILLWKILCLVRCENIVL